MNRKDLQKLVDQARDDPQFFHALVFDTASVLQQIDYLDRETKAALVRISPEQAIATIAGARSLVEPPQEGYAP